MTATHKEFWRWSEYRLIMPDKNWRNAEVITAGVDVGSVSSKAVIMVDGEIYAVNIKRTGSSSPDSARQVLEGALENTGMKLNDIDYIVGTGYGRVNVPMAHTTLTEISCHAKGANYIWGPSVRTILDVGGQDIKAIKCDDKGKVQAFLMNDKCAAGTGRGMEVLADLLQVPIEDMGALSLKVDIEPEPVSCTCVAFARTEAMDLLRRGWLKEKVLAAYMRAMAIRMANLLERVECERELVITGGQSKNIGIVTRVAELTGIQPLPTPDWKKDGRDPMAAGAIGAAIYAKALYEKKQRS